MAKTEIRNVITRYQVDAYSLTKSLRSIDASAARTANSMQRLERGAAQIGKIFAGLVSAVAIKGLADGFKSTAEQMDKMAKSAQSVGVSVEALSALQFAAGQSGASFEQLERGLQKISIGIAEMEAGTSKASQALRTLGVDAAGGTVAALQQIADRFSQMPDGINKTALAMQVFGERVGPDLIPFLNQGADGIQGLMDRAEELGLVINSATAAQAEKFNDALAEMGYAIDGIQNHITAGAMPAFSALAQTMAEASSAGETWQSVGEAVGAVATFIAEQTTYAAGAFEIMGKRIGAWAAAIKEAVTGNFTVAKNIINELGADIEAITARTNAQIAALRANVAAAKAEAQAAATGAATPAVSVPTIVIPKTGGGGGGRSRGGGGGGGISEAQKKINEQMREGKRIFEQTRTAAEEYTAQIVKLNELLAANAINQDTFNRAVVQAQDKLAKATKETKDNTDKLSESLLNIAESNMTSWLDSATDGTFKLKDAMVDLIKEVVKLAAKMAILKAVNSAFGLNLGSVGTFAKGGAFSQLALPQGVYTQPTFFHMPGSGQLKKYARGGVLGERGAEAILPLARTANGDLGVQAQAANVNINVVNNVGEYATATASRSLQGEIQIVIDRISSDIQRGGTQLSSALEGTYHGLAGARA